MTVCTIPAIARAVGSIARGVNILCALHCWCPGGPVVLQTFGDLSESVFACVLGWVSNRGCF